MSAFVVPKEHVDLLVRAAEHYGASRNSSYRFRWWQTDHDGDYAGWRVLDRYAEQSPAAAPDEPERVTPSQLGQILLDENVRSVAHRYPDADADAGELPGPVDAYYLGPYIYRDPGVVLTPGEVFAAIDCLTYQSCETGGWERTEAAAVLRALRVHVCQFVDGYADAGGNWTAERLAARRGARA